MYSKIIDSKFFKNSALLLAALMLLSSFTMPAGQVVVKSGTLVPLELLNTISSKECRTGQIITFRVLRDIVVDGKTAIEAGALAKGQVIRVKKTQLFGGQGELQVNIKSVTAVDGTEVFLNGGDLSDEGDNKVVVSVVLTFLCLFGFLIKGSNAEIVAGAQCQAFVSGNTTVNVN